MLDKNFDSKCKKIKKEFRLIPDIKLNVKILRLPLQESIFFVRKYFFAFVWDKIKEKKDGK